MLRVILTFLLTASWPGPAARGAEPGAPPYPASPQNQAPQTVDYIDVGPLTVGGSSETVNVSSYFSDPNNDTLTYSVNNPSPSVATVSISGSTVTVAPVAIGTTGKVVVTARDPGGLTATQDFNVTVQNPPPPPPVNRAPTTVGSISNVTLRVSGSSATRNVSGKFSDPDNDTLTYSVNSPNPSIVTVSISGSTVTVAPVAAGTTGKIIVTARDPGGLTATQDFTATVENPPPPPPPPPVNRAPTTVGSISNVSLRVGGSSATRGVSGKFSDPDNDTLTYSVNSLYPSIVTVSISESTVTVAPVAAGTTGKIIVTARDPGGLTATQDFTATVENPPPPPPPPPVNRAPTTVGSISNVSLRVGGSSATRGVSGKFSDPDNDTLTYSVNSPNPSIVTVSISGSTVTVAPVAAGTIGEIIVTARDPGGLTATQDFTASVENPPPPPPPPPVNRPPTAMGPISNVSLRVGGSSATRSVSGKFSDPDNDTLTYSVNNPSPSVATVSISGSTVTVAPVAAGTTGKIIVTARDPGGLTATQDFTATVENHPPPPPPIVATVRVSPSSASIEEGKTLQFTATAYDSDDNVILGKTFMWTSSDTSVATISASGLATAKHAGITTITALVDSTSNAVKLTVTEPTPPPPEQVVDRVTVTPAPASIEEGKTLQFTATAYDSVNTKILGKTFMWTSSDTSVATISASGLATAKHAGITAITALVDSTSNAVKLTVTEPTPPPPEQVVDRVTVTPAPASIEEGKTLQFTATAYDSVNTKILGKTFMWTSSDTSVATISVSGLATAKHAGITAITALVDSTSNAVKLTVTEQLAAADRVTVTPPSPSIEEGETQQFTATALDSANMAITGKTFTWTSSDTTVANIDTLGLATAMDAGATTITATTDGVSGTATLMVTNPLPPDVDSVTVTPPSPSIEEGETQQFTATALDSANGAITGKTFTWTSSDATVANIDTLGQATAMDAGATTITATTDGVSGTASLTVIEPPTPQTCPALVGSIADQTLTVGGNAEQIVLTSYFSFPAVFVPIYAITLSDTTVATTSLAGDTLTVTPVAPGTDTVSVTVSKQDCEPVKQSFVVTVGDAIPPPPCPAMIMDAPIADQALFAGAGISRIDLTGHFENIDRDGIEITVTSPSPETAVVSIAGSALKIDPKSAGQIDVTVTVTDTAESDACDPVSLSIMIKVIDPLSTPWSVSNENVYRLTGNVGIGVSSPDQKLVVDGNIRAEEVYVPMTPADYVFEADYDLMPLEDVARHIRDHGHLPAVASGAEMKANGIGINRMQTLLLEKIEELSLHVIGQHEQLRAQGHSIDSQQRRLKLQNEHIRQLDHRLERLEQ